MLDSPKSEREANPQPVWFDPKVFHDASFNAEHYVSDLSRFVPLEEFSDHLEAHLSHLKQKLVEVINENYNEFVSLGSQLSGVEGAVLRIKKPMQDLQDKVNAVQAQIEGEVNALQSALGRRKQIRAAREKLELMQEAVHLEGKVEKLIVELQGLPSGSMDLTTKSSFLERVAGEVSKLDLLMAQGKELPFIKAIEKRREPSRKTLRSHLEECLAAALTESDPSASFTLLHAFSLAGDVRAGEQVVRTTILSRLVRDVTASVKGSDKQNMSMIAKELLSKLSNDCGSLLNRVYSSDSGLQGFNFLGNAVIAELHVQVAGSLPGIFSQVFHENYTGLVALLDGLEKYCATSAAVETFRSSEPVQALLRRFNLQVYFTMRFQELADSVERAFQKGPFQLSSSQDIKCEALAVWWKNVQQCLSDDVFVAPLSDSFVRLLLQLVSRLSTWVVTGIENTESEANDQSSFPQVSEDQLLLLSDLTTLKHRLDTGTADRLSMLLAGSVSDPRIIERAIELLRHGAANLLDSQDRILERVIVSVSASCAEIIKQCVGATVGTMFGAGVQGSPKEPSEYVIRILEPLMSVIENPKLVNMPRGVRDRITAEVTNLTCARYEGSLQELLTIVKKSRMSLKRIKGRMADPSDASTQSSKTNDLDMVLQQHFLNVQELGRILQRAECNVVALESYRMLWKLVAPDEQKDFPTL